jgi:polysaccharide biosynthesis protein PslH
VLFLSQVVPYPPHGGVLQRGYHLLRQLGRSARVDLLAFVHPNLLPTQARQDESYAALQAFCERVEYFSLWAKASALHRVGALAASAVTRDPFSAVAHRSAAFRAAVQARLATGAVDLIHVDTIGLSSFVEGVRGVPLVVTHHNIESMLMERRASVHRGLARRYLAHETAKLRRYEQLQSPRYDVNIVVSEPDGEALRALAPGARIAVVPNGVDVDYFVPGTAPETPSLVYTGGLTMFANLDAVLYFLRDIWPRIVSQQPDARFYAVGRHPPAEVRAFAARDPRVVVTGYLEDIRPTVASAAVYVVPLRVGGGTRLKVLDAMAMGKAMVSTSIGCEGIDVRPGEHLLVADTPEAFAEATVSLLRNPAQRQALGRAARARAETVYAWERVGERLLQAYAQAEQTRAAS